MVPVDQPDRMTQPCRAVRANCTAGSFPFASIPQSVRVHIYSVRLAARRDTRDSSLPSPGNRLCAERTAKTARKQFSERRIKVNSAHKYTVHKEVNIHYIL